MEIEVRKQGVIDNPVKMRAVRNVKVWLIVRDTFVGSFEYRNCTSYFVGGD